MDKKDSHISFRVDSETHALLRRVHPKRSANLTAREIVLRKLDDISESTAAVEPEVELANLERTLARIVSRIGVLRGRLAKRGGGGAP